jgi:methylase of polypeptide subunit release factors
MCCGSGALGIALSLSLPGAFASHLFLDASPEAVLSARANLELHGLPGRAVQWEAGQPVDAGEPAFVVCNPPFLPESDALDHPDWERPCVASPEGGLAAVRRCLQSVAGTPHPLVLKCLAAQIPQLAALGGGHRMTRAVESEQPEVAFSYWEP